MKKQLLFVLMIFVSVLAIGQNMDLRIVKSLNKNNMPVWDKTMRGVSFSVMPAMPITVAGIWSYGYYNNDKVMMRNGYKSAITIGFAALTSVSLKYLVNRERPFKAHPDEVTQRDFGIGPFSFPSGHTTSAFATATALSLSCQKWYVTAPSFIYAGFVGYSRLRLGVHYPSDVLGGMIIGIGSGLLTWQIDKLVNGK